MQLSDEIKNEIKADVKAAKKMWLPWWGVLCLIGSLPILWLFDRFGRFDLARPAFFSAATIAFAIAIKWKLRRRVWLWITTIVIVALHVVLILSVPWTTKWVPAAVSAGFYTADFFVILAILAVVEKLVEKHETRLRNSLPRT
jgi:hypothetical protein